LINYKKTYSQKKEKLINEHNKKKDEELKQILTHKLQINKTPEYLNVKPKVFNVNNVDATDGSGNKHNDECNVSNGSAIKVSGKKDSKSSKNEKE